MQAIHGDKEGCPAQDFAQAAPQLCILCGHEEVVFILLACTSHACLGCQPFNGYQHIASQTQTQDSKIPCQEADVMRKSSIVLGFDLKVSSQVSRFDQSVLMHTLALLPLLHERQCTD